MTYVKSHLEPVLDAETIHEAIVELAARFQDSDQVVEHWIGFQGGHANANLYLHKEAGVWVAHGWAENRESFVFGTGAVISTGGPATITCEINIPYDGCSLRFGGAVLTDQKGNLFLGHTGKIGGGRKGIGKQAFFEFWGDGADVHYVEWASGRTAPVVVIGYIDADDFLERVGDFVRKVAAFKEAAVDK